ncbi:MAG: hypothetical protein IKE24_05130 [Clostridia bacterium]|nr:hypothetical protein [Clostridia bacterium]
MMKISPVFSDGAVLCRRKEIRIFGEAEEGTLVRCELLGPKGVLMARGEGETRNGRFLVILPPQEAAVGCRLVIAGGGEAFTALDICVGEVFLAGGQSNMELELQNADEGQTLIAGHVNPLVRYFNVPKFGFFGEERTAAWQNARWEAIGPGRGKDMSAAAYFFAMKLQREKNVPVGIIDSYLGGTSVTCWMDAAWLERTGEGARYLREYAEETKGITMEDFLKKESVFRHNLDQWNADMAEWKAAHPGGAWEDMVAEIGECPWDPPKGPASPYRPAGLYDTMIAPLTPLALTGVLYYQGEEDTWRTEKYDTLMMSLIDRWRAAFEEEELPFLFVQLPMWIAKGAEDSRTWPALRLCQSRVRDRMRNTGMVCLLDQGEFDNIHPTNKRVVGERLFELAKRVVYGETDSAEAPRVTGRRIEGSMMTLKTDQALMSRDGKEPAFLELAGADGVFRPARAMLEGPVLHLTAAGVSHPLHCRYAWTDYGAVNLFGANGLPLEPFLF